MPSTLVLMAAGMGSRYGGPKQLDPMGPSGETLLDYSIYDARRAGFSKVVLVIRRAMQDAFERGVGARWRPLIPVDFAHQELDALPPGYEVPSGREKPWGTGHAVLAAEEAVEGSFAVLNADDFYGEQAFRVLQEHLRDVTARGEPEYATVGFPLRETLSEAGPVTRAVLETNRNNRLIHIEEIHKIEKAGSHGRFHKEDGESGVVDGDTLVSMNLWGFTPDIFGALRGGFEAFLDERGEEPKSEFLLPDFVEDLVHEDRATVRVLRGEGPWVGVTYPEDKQRVTSFLADLTRRGTYPEGLGAG